MNDITKPRRLSDEQAEANARRLQAAAEEAQRLAAELTDLADQMNAHATHGGDGFTNEILRLEATLAAWDSWLPGDAKTIAAEHLITLLESERQHAQLLALRRQLESQALEGSGAQATRESIREHAFKRAEVIHRARQNETASRFQSVSVEQWAAAIVDWNGIVSTPSRPKNGVKPWHRVVWGLLNCAGLTGALDSKRFADAFRRARPQNARLNPKR